MKKINRKKLSILALFTVISVFCCLLSFDQVWAEPRVSLKGMILPMSEKGDLYTFVLWTQDKKWHFRITKTNDENPTSSDVWEMLNEVSPPQIHLVGNKEIIAGFFKEAAAGKVFQLDGILYVADGVMMLSSAKELKK